MMTCSSRNVTDGMHGNTAMSCLCK